MLRRMSRLVRLGLNELLRTMHSLRNGEKTSYKCSIEEDYDPPK